MDSAHKTRKTTAHDTVSDFRADDNADQLDQQLDLAYAAIACSLAPGLARFDDLWHEAQGSSPGIQVQAASGALSGLFAHWGNFEGLGCWVMRFNQVAVAAQASQATKATKGYSASQTAHDKNISDTARIRLLAGRLSAERLAEQSIDDRPDLSAALDACLKLTLDMSNSITLATRLHACPVLLECLSLQRKKAEIVELEWLIFRIIKASSDVSELEMMATAAPQLLGRCADWLSATYHVIDDRESANRCQLAAEDIARHHGLAELEFDLLKRPIRDALEDENYALADTLHQRMKALLNPQQIGQLTEYWDLTGRLHLGQQQVALALDSFRRAVEAARASEVPAQRLTVLLTMSAYAYVAADEPAMAAELLAQITHRAGGRQREIYLCISKLVAAYFALQEVTSAVPPVHILAEAINEAARLNIVRFMRPLPRQCAWLCGRALEHQIQVAFISRVIRERNLAPDSPYNEAWPWPIKIYGLRKFAILRLDGAALAESDAEGDGKTKTKGKGQAKPQAILHLLLSSGGGPVQVTRMVASLWPDSDPSAGRKSFDMALMRLRKQFEPNEIVILADGALQLASQSVWTDVAAFVAVTQQIEAGSPADLTRLKLIRKPLIEQLFNLYRHPFLEGFDDPWSLGTRDKLKARFLRSIERLAELAIATDDQAMALMLYERGIEAEPLAENLYRGLMACYEARGEFADALRVYRRCRDMLSICLSMPPSAATEAMMQRIYKLSAR